MGSCHLVPGGPRQSLLWSRNVSLIQEGGEVCVCGCVCACKHIYVCMCGLAYISALHSPQHTPPLDSKLGHIRVCVHSSVGPDRGLGEGRVLSAPVSTP